MAVPGVRIHEDLPIYLIFTAVSAVTEISVTEMKSKSRKRERVEARQMCMYLLRKYTKLSLKKIGDMFGGRDHTTAIHARETIKDLIHTEPNIKQTVQKIEHRLAALTLNQNS